MALLRRALVLTAAMLLLSSVGFACGGGNDEPTPTPDTSPVDVTIQVIMGDNFFQPDQLEVGAGQRFRIELANEGRFVHNLRITGPDGEYGTADDLVSVPDVQRAGESGQLVGQIDQPGTYNFRCDFHPIEMVGTIVVR